MKICKQCGQEKEISEFWNEKSKKCLKCRKETQETYVNSGRKKARLDIYVSSGRAKATTKKRYIEHPELKERDKLTTEKRYIEHPELKERDKESWNKSEAKRMKNPFYAAMKKIHKQAKYAIKKLIYNKKILPHKEQKCAICNKSYSGQNSIEYHHFSYTCMNIVTPLCAEHHSKVHAENPTIYPKSAFDGIDIPETHKNKIILL